MIADIAAGILKDMGWTWNKSDGSKLHPNGSDVERALDEAIHRLYTRPVGTQLEVGHLIIQKAPGGVYDVYVHIGETK